MILGEFKKGLSDAFIGELERIAATASWWNDVLHDRDLIIGVRNEYLNVYWQGQSIFRVAYDGGKVRVSTHPKYLLNPGLSKQVPFDWQAGRFGELPLDAMLRDFEGSVTLNRLKSAAGIFSGGEKQGVHIIARDNMQVVDVEVAFNANELETAKNLPRIDIAAFERASSGYELVFWEAKLFGNKELRSRGEKPPVLDQLHQYGVVLDHYRDQVVAGYKRVAQNLRSISDMSGGARLLGEAVREVANGEPLILGQPPAVGLMVFGFDADQRDGDNWALHNSTLKNALKGRLLSKGNAKGLMLK